MGRMDRKVAFLTGGGAGIARACARAFVAEGAKVALVDINAEVGRAAEQEMRDAGGEAIFIEADVTREESVQAAMERHAQHFGRLDVLVNCAGGSLLEDAPVHEMKLEVWQRTISLNLLHPFLCCKYGIPHMMRGGGGAIINFSSQTGLTGSVRPAYAAAKGGIGSFTKTLAAQYAQFNIRANAIAPGSIRTERSLKRYQSKDWMLSENPSPAVRERRATEKLYPYSIGDPVDIARIAVFLGSEESRMITGTTIAADGGRSSYLKVYAGD